MESENQKTKNANIEHNDIGTYCLEGTSSEINK